MKFDSFIFLKGGICNNFEDRFTFFEFLHLKCQFL